MKLKKETIQELKKILKEEYDTELAPADLERFAYSLVDYFDLLIKIVHRDKFGNSPSHHIELK